MQQRRPLLGSKRICKNDCDLILMGTKIMPKLKKKEDLDDIAWSAARMTGTIANGISRCYRDEYSYKTLTELIKTVEIVEGKLAQIKVELKREGNNA